jgi:hypothetical protein
MTALRNLTALTRISRADRWLTRLVALCVVALVAELLWPHPLVTEPTATDRPVAQTAATQTWQPAPRPEYQLIAERPLFTVDRRPFVPPAPETLADVAPVAPPVQFELSAIVTSAGTQVALLKIATSAESFKVRVNETVQGWMLVEVRADSVVLRQGADTIVVELQPERALVGRTGMSATSPVARGQ